MSAQIQHAAETVIGVMLGRTASAAEIAQTLADSRLLASDGRRTADWAELATVQRELTAIRETHEAYVAEVEGRLAELAVLRLANPRLQQQAAAAVDEAARLRTVLRDISEYCQAAYCTPPCPSAIARQALSVPAITSGSSS